MVSRNRRRPPAPTRPSWFFIAALLLGLILLIWGASAALRRQTNFRTPPAKSADFTVPGAAALPDPKHPPAAIDR